MEKNKIIFVALRNGQVYLIDKLNYKIISKIQCHYLALTSMDISDKYLLTTDVKGSIRLWNTSDLRIAAEIQVAFYANKDEGFKAVFLQNENKIISYGSDG